MSKRIISTPELVEQLAEHDRRYAMGRPTIDDAGYDAMRASLAHRDPDHVYLRGTGAMAPVDRRRRETMPFVVGSLDKLRPDGVAAWMRETERRIGRQRGWLVLPKFDGQSVTLHYTQGVLDRAWTRGDIVEGESRGVMVLPAARWVQGTMPRMRPNDVYNLEVGEVCVRGEVVMHTSIWNHHYQPRLDRLRAQIAESTSDAERAQLQQRLDREYKNPRNLCSGILGALDAAGNAVHLRRCTFVALQLWRRVRGRWVRPPSTHAEWVLLSLMGFTTATMPTRWAPGHGKILAAIRAGHECLRPLLPVHPTTGGIGSLAYWDAPPLAADVVERLAAMRRAVDVRLDGLVVQPIEINRAVGLGEHLRPRPPFMMSIKLDAQAQDRITGRVGAIEWRTRKRGTVVPRLVLQQSLHFDGVDVDHCTLNNARNVRRWGLRSGRPIRMIRSGDVIPHLVGVWDRGAWHATKTRHTNRAGRETWIEAPGIADPRIAATLPRHCPECDTPLRWTRVNREDAEPTHLYCGNEQCPGRTGMSVLSFFRLLGVDDVAGGVVAHLMQNGMRSVPQIMREATPARLMQLEGYQSRKAEIVSRAIAGALVEKPLAKIMHASNLFSDERSSLGSTRLGDIIAACGEGMIERASDASLRARLATLRGLGPSGLDLLLAGLPAWRRLWAELKPHYRRSTKTGLADVVAAFTSFRDHEMHAFIERNGGRVAGMSKKTTVLFSAGKSRKTDRADELGCEVVDQTDAWQWLRERVPEEKK